MRLRRSVRVGWFALFLMSAVLGLGATRAPLNADFNDGQIPTPPFFRVTDPEGRISIAYSETDLVTNSVPSDGIAPNSFSGGNRMRGNYYQCDHDVLLQQFGAGLGLAETGTISFLVYQGTTSNGIYSLIASNSVTASPATGVVMSADFNLPLTQNVYYAFASAWTNSTAYYYGGSHPQSTPFGSSFKGYQYTGYPAPATIFGGMNNYVYHQQFACSTNHVVRMDDEVPNSTYSTNSLSIIADLAGYTDVTLRFRHRAWWDDAQYADGIFLASSTHPTPVKIYDLKVADQDWHEVTIDLDAAATSNGITFTTATLIRFQQMDNYPVGSSAANSDGRDFDDIQLFAPPDFEALSLQSDGSSAISAHWKVGDELDIPLNFSFITRNGDSDLTVDLSHSFTLREASGTARLFRKATNTCTVTRLTTATNTVLKTFTLPAALVCTNLLYTIEAEADVGLDVPEALETNNTTSMTLFLNQYSGKLWFDDIQTDMTITDWGARLTNSPTEHWITGSGTFLGKPFTFTHLDVVKDQATLDYALTSTNATTFTFTFGERDKVADVSYWRDSDVVLSKDGAYADIRVLFPAGLGVSSNSDLVLESQWVFPDQKLNQSLYPSVAPTVTESLFVVEESKPLGYTVTGMQWEPDLGRFSFAKDGVWFVREAQYSQLEAKSGSLVDPAMAKKKSNAQYYRAVNVLSHDVTVNTGPSGDARVDTELGMTNVTLTAHFPYNVSMNWSSDSALSISADLVDGSSAQLKGPSATFIKYEPNCPGPTCAGDVGMKDISMSPSDNSVYSIDGGIRTPGIITVGGALEWGTRYNNEFAQQTTNFTTATLYIPGTFIRGDQATLGAFNGPGEILLSGMGTNSFTAMERPGTPEYAEGLADYAGMNMRVASDGAGYADSIIGGTNTGWWVQTDRSKYYARWAGVSGIHEADKFLKSMTIYDYPFQFSNYGLSYLDNSPQESRINGQVYVKEPCDITMDFEALMLDCIGELGPAALANADAKTLVYWDADIQPISLFFAPTASSSCGNQQRVLCMGLTTYSGNIDDMLSGILGFKADGNLGTPADQINGVVSRLSVPSEIELDGPGDETYYFMPVAMPYYNDYASSGDDMTSNGWINVVGALDVAFFTDLPIHFHTSASTNIADPAIYMAGGWEESGATFFNVNDQAGFDTHNAGFPVGLVTKDYYRHSPDPSDDTYRPRAQRYWLDVIDLDYPLEWSNAAKSFKSPETKTVDMLVLNIEHQTDYLSAENAEISFGLQYDGIPQINLANMAFNAIDEQTGMASAFSDAVGDAVHQTVERGIDAMDSTLSDLPEELFDPVFEVVLDPVVDNFYNALSNAYSATPDGDYYSTVVTQYIHGVGSDPFENADYILKHLANSAVMATNLAASINSRLDEALGLIDAFIGMVPDGANPDLPGILFQTNNEYGTLSDLGIGILQVLANTLYSSLQDTIDEELGAVLQQAEPSLDAITETMTSLRSGITNVQAQLESTGSFTTELADTLDTTALDSALDDMSASLCSYFAAVQTDGVAFDDYTATEIKTILRQAITDAFYGSDLCADAQSIIRSRLYEADAAIREAIDSAFQQLNKAMRDMASEYLSGVDDEINGMLGKMSDLMGGGEIDGYAHIRGDSLSELRLDGKFQWEVPDEMAFNAYLIISQLDSQSDSGCGEEGDMLPEVTLGTEGFGISWLGSDIRADIATKFAFRADTNSIPQLIGLGGSFDMVEGEIGFEAFVIDKLYAGVAFGELENYISANVSCQFSSYAVEGGAFFGRACSTDPFSWDPDVQAVLGDPPFTGIYMYGEGWMPIVDYGCVFRIKAGVGAGIFAFLDGPIGGKIFMGASGEALCVVGVDGEITLVGLKDGDDLRMSGKGKISGKAGSCPFCVKFSKTVTMEYNNGSWSADY